MAGRHHRRPSVALGVSSLKEGVEKWNRIWTTTTTKPDNAVVVSKEEHDRFFPFESNPVVSIQSSSSKVPQQDEAASQVQLSSEVWGYVALGMVPILWGTYGPIVRAMYELEIPVPGFVFSSCYFTVAALTTVALAVSQSSLSGTESSSSKSSPFVLHELQQLFTDRPTVLGGMELGVYVLLANCFHVVGLETVSSDKAGFLLQSTCVPKALGGLVDHQQVTHSLFYGVLFLSDNRVGSLGLGLDGSQFGRRGRPDLVGLWRGLLGHCRHECGPDPRLLGVPPVECVGRRRIGDWRGPLVFPQCHSH